MIKALNLKSGILLITTGLILFTGVVMSRPIQAATELTPACARSFLGFPTWHKYLEKTDSPECDIVAPEGGFLKGNGPWLIGAAVIEIMLRFAAIGAVMMVIFGGFKIMTSNGSPEAVTTGRNSIFNALIGLAIAVVATSVVSYLVTTLTSNAPIDAVTGLPRVEDTVNVMTILLGIIYRLAAGVTILLITIAGFNFMTAGGDPQKVAKARQGIINSLIGLAITLSAVAIVAMIGGKL